MRLSNSARQAEAATARVQEIEPNWRPGPSLYENIEGEIAANEHVVRQAQDRLNALERGKATPGPYAGESVVAPLGGGRPNAETQREINRIGRETGCHTCGTKDPGTPR